MNARTPSDPTAVATRLAAYTAQARAIILARQDPRTGLLPASTAITVHGDYTHAWVRDNVYSILAIWALDLAHRDQQPAVAKELRERVEALMRGLLAAMMKQAHKVERFKHTQHPLDALHAKYSTSTGEPVVGDAEWGHLQIDATAIFLLLLAQMSASGLRLVRTVAEASFVQNLVHYLARAYRTPDYGIWERGHKRNEGRAEINASSVGMAKAALEAISGYNLLPGWAPRILVQGDDIAHARMTLAGLLPRESESKETDAALLSIIGFPAFAVDDPALVEATRARIIAKLQGRYGCKRFLRDGHQTVVEDHSRLHYEPGELQRFRRIESEWPLFFCYLLLDAVLRGDEVAAADYRGRLEGLMQERDGQRLLPELYLVPPEAVEAEREQPHSQDRVPNDNVPLVWAQSLYLVGALLQDGLIRPEQLDPLGRHRILEAPEPAPVTVQLALLATDRLVQARLASHGIAAQTLAEVQPVQVRYADELDAALTRLGQHEALGLSGRPRQRLGSLATSRVYRDGEQTVVFLPALFNRQGFYLGLDNRLLVDEFQAEVAYLRTHWRADTGSAGGAPAQPLLALLIGEPMLDAIGADGLLAYLRQVSPACAGAAADGLRAAPLAQLLPAAATAEIDGLPAAVALPADPAAAAAVLDWEEAATRALSPARAAALERTHDDAALERQLERSRNPYEQVEILGLLSQRRGLDAPTALGGTLRQLTGAVYARAGRQRRWGVIRRAAGVLDIHDETLEDAVAQIVVRQKQVSVGRAYDAAAIIAAPLGNGELFERLRAFGGDDARGRVLIQEIVLLLGTLIKADATLFKGTLTLRPWYLLLLITGRLALEHGLSQAEAFDHLLDCSPQALLARLREVIVREQEVSRDLVRLQSLHTGEGGGALVAVQFPAGNDPVLSSDLPDWLAWRELSGVVTRLPADFHERIWALLRQVPGLVIGDQLDARNRLDSTLARADSTPGERGFALQVEELLNKIHAPEYRQLTIEALLAVSDILRANADLRLDSWLVMDVLVGIAVRQGWQQAMGEAHVDADYNEHRAHAWEAFYASPPHRVANLVMAAMAYLVERARREALEVPVEAPEAPVETAAEPDVPGPGDLPGTVEVVEASAPE
ncbi:phosphorylase kinase alpha/beta subunit [Sphaerotilus hippei]|uniref:Phosphorylase kinase alpha/beta subunit n=1 Tax=Sphaerotilus hippei TaxID=744406 RepID=A0A318H5Q8_9BURK|nr:glycoside hydrolase family 15 protein [Sphaerotilus hippei]PXW96690.1 phosphorylase kinase alpha/beta subunit [Sphaerotilus hippei]